MKFKIKSSTPDCASTSEPLSFEIKSTQSSDTPVVSWNDIIGKPSCFNPCTPNGDLLSWNSTILSITNGTDKVLSDVTFALSQASSVSSGYLSSTDWNIFNDKFDQPTGTTSDYIRGDGSVAAFPTFASTYFAQGGNSFSTDADLGTNDNFGLNFKTNNTTRGGFSNSGDFTLLNLSSVNDGVVTASTGGILSKLDFPNDQTYYLAGDNTFQPLPSSLALIFKNGINEAFGEVKLGGPLTEPTVITTDAVNTLALSGLLPGAIGEDLLTMDISSNEIRKISSSLFELVANKSINPALGTSNTLYPTQLAVKTYVDAAVSGFFILQGDWNAATNTPDLTGAVPTGWAYRVSVAGSTNLGGITDWEVNDVAAKTATGWIKFDNSNSVTSVNGYTGAVVLTTTEISEGTNLYYTNARGIGSLLTGYVSGAGTITSSDTILSAIQKLNGNLTTGYVPYTGATTNLNMGSHSIKVDMTAFDANSGFIAKTTTTSGMAGMQFWNSSNSQRGSLYYEGTTGGAYPDRLVLQSLTSNGLVLNSPSTQIELRNVIAMTGAVNQGGGTVTITGTDNSTTKGFIYQSLDTTEKFSITNLGVVTFNALSGTGTRLPSLLASGALNVMSGTGFLKLTGSVVSFDNSTYVPTSTTLNINGVVQNLSANRTWRTAQASTGVLTYGGISVASSTTVNIGPVTGNVVDNETNPDIPTTTSITYAGATNVTVPTIASGTGTYVLIEPDGLGGGTLVFQNSFPTSTQRKEMIYLSKISHPNLTSISFAIDEVDFSTSPLSQFRDLFQAITYINTGVTVSPNAALTISNTAGTILGDGIRFTVDRTNPNNLPVSSSATTSFLVLNQSGAAGAFTTTVDVANYDVGGVTTAVGGGTNRSTLQYLYYAPGVGFAFQRGQTVYASLNDAIQAVGRESFVIRPNLVGNSILIGVFALRHTTTDLSDTSFARFFPSDKFGQVGGSSSGISTATFQTTYNNSTIPQIITSVANGAFSIRRGSAADTDAIYVGQNGAGTITWSVDGNGVGYFNGQLTANGSILRYYPTTSDGAIYLEGTTPAANNYKVYYGANETGLNGGTSTFLAVNSSLGLVLDSSLRTLLGYTSSVSSDRLQVNGGVYISGTSTFLSDLIMSGNRTIDWGSGNSISIASSTGNGAITTANNLFLISPTVSVSNILSIGSIANDSASNAFLTSASGVVKYRTAAQVLSDIGGVSSSATAGFIPYMSTATNVANGPMFYNGSNIASSVPFKPTEFILLDNNFYIIRGSSFTGSLSADDLVVSNLTATGKTLFSNNAGYWLTALANGDASFIGKTSTLFTSGFQLDNAGVAQSRWYETGNVIIFDRAASTTSYTWKNNTVTQLVLDDDGNIGQASTGVSSWDGSFRFFQQQGHAAWYSSTSSNQTFFVDNIYYNSGLKYFSNGYGTRVTLNSVSGLISFEIAPSGTTGNTATLATILSADYTGRIRVGIDTEGVELFNSGYGFATSRWYFDGTHTLFNRSGSSDFAWTENGTVQMRLYGGGGALGIGTFATQNHYPLTDNTYFLGKNSSTSPFAWKGVILKDTTNGNYYRIEVTAGVVTATIV